MGVRGLTSLIDSFEQVWVPSKLTYLRPGAPPVGKVVIDGSGLMYYLYFSHNLNCIAGGQYAEYYHVLKEYLRALTSCGLSLFIVLDGTLTTSKFDTYLSREKDMIRRTRVMVASDREQVSEKLLPPFSLFVFVSVLQELGIKYAFCDQDADKVVALMAKQHGGCAMSQDSDFFIYDIPGMYMPFNFVRVVNGGVQISRTSADRIASKLGVNVAMLPLFASLAGNDYIQADTLRSFHSQVLQLFPKKENTTVRHAVIVAIAQWLSQFGSDVKAAIDAAVTLAASAATTASASENSGEGAAASVSAAADEGGANADGAAEKKEEETPVFDSEQFRSQLESAVQSYSLAPKDLLVGQETSLTLKSGAPLPPQLVGAFRSGAVHRALFDVLTRHQFWASSTLVEDVALPSAYRVGDELRRICYGILLQKEGCVTEFIRNGLDFGPSEGISPLLELEDKTALPSILDIPSLSPDAKRALLLKIFHSESIVPALRQLSADLQLAVLALRYWIRTSPTKLSAREVMSVMINMSRITPKEKAPKKSADTRPSFLSSHNVHFCAQYQAILLHAQFVNSLLQNPLQPIQAQRLYDGLFLHKLLHELEPRKNLGAGRVLRSHNASPDLFLQLSAAILGDDLAAYIDGEVSLERQNTKQQERGVAAPVPTAISTNIFAAAFDDENEEEGESDEEEEEKKGKKKESKKEKDAETGEAKKVQKKKKKQQILNVDPEIAALAAEINSMESPGKGNTSAKSSKQKPKNKK